MNNMTVTMSMQDYNRYEDYVNRYTSLLVELKDCALVNPNDNLLILQRNKILSLFAKILKTELMFNDYLIDIE